MNECNAFGSVYPEAPVPFCLVGGQFHFFANLDPTLYPLYNETGKKANVVFNAVQVAKYAYDHSLNNIAEATEEVQGDCASDVYDNFVVPFILITKDMDSDDTYTFKELLEDVKSNAATATDATEKEKTDVKNIYRCLRTLCKYSAVGF